MPRLAAHRIELLVDVRAFPSSTCHPQSNRGNLGRELPAASIGYRWLGKKLGGHRNKRRENSPHTGLRNQGFRNYANHMDREEFRQGIAELLELAARPHVAYMCAELLWWRCHRTLVSNYLLGVCHAEVVHIFDEKKATPHKLHPAARAVGARLL